LFYPSFFLKQTLVHYFSHQLAFTGSLTTLTVAFLSQLFPPSMEVNQVDISALASSLTTALASSLTTALVPLLLYLLKAGRPRLTAQLT
jgi:hypothetical protein